MQQAENGEKSKKITTFLTSPPGQVSSTEMVPARLERGKNCGFGDSRAPNLPAPGRGYERGPGSSPPAQAFLGYTGVEPKAPEPGGFEGPRHQPHPKGCPQHWTRLDVLAVNTGGIFGNQAPKRLRWNHCIQRWILLILTLLLLQSWRWPALRSRQDAFYPFSLTDFPSGPPGSEQLWMLNRPTATSSPSASTPHLGLIF